MSPIGPRTKTGQGARQRRDRSTTKMIHNEIIVTNKEINETIQMID
jgi:hypothetical protein